MERDVMSRSNSLKPLFEFMEEQAPKHRTGVSDVPDTKLCEDIKECIFASPLRQKLGMGQETHVPESGQLQASKVEACGADRQKGLYHQFTTISDCDSSTTLHTDPMENNNENPPREENRFAHLALMVANGQVIPRPLSYHHRPILQLVDLELFNTNIYNRMSDVFLNHPGVRSHYSGAPTPLDNIINGDIRMLANYATAICYNRLRTMLERTDPQSTVTHMNPRAPVHNQLELPAWIASVIGSVGPSRHSDGPIDQLLTYYTTSDRAQNYGREKQVAFNIGPYARITEALKLCNVRFAPVDFQNMNGSAFPTITSVTNADNTWNIIGTIHPSHYENEDIARFIFVSDADLAPPFQDSGFVASKVDNAAVLTALAAVPAPEPQGVPRHVARHWMVNLHGINPATEAVGNIPATTASCWIIGRGFERFYSHLIATNVSAVDVSFLMRERLLATS